MYCEKQMSFFWAVVVVTLLSVCLSALLIPELVKLSYRKRWFDGLDGRKIHHGNVSRLGGVAFTASILTALALTYLFSFLVLKRDIPFFFHSRIFFFVLAALLLIYIEGMLDDVKGLPYRAKFLAQFLSATLLAMAGFVVENMHGLLGVWNWPLFVSVPFSIFLIVLLINAMNLIDGIDGLSSGLAIIATFTLGILFLIKGLFSSALLTFATFGVLLPFFYYNVFCDAKKGRKVFMGDCGSQTIGLLLALLAIHYAKAPGAEASALGDNPLVLSFSLVVIPCFDVVRVMWGRMRRGCSPFSADKTHIHHRLLALGLSQRKSLLVILAFALLFILVNFSLVSTLGGNIVILVDITLWLAFHRLLTVLTARRAARSGGA